MMKNPWPNPKAKQAVNERFWPHLFRKDLEHRITQAKNEGRNVQLGEMTVRIGAGVNSSIKAGRYDKTLKLVDALTSDPSAHLLFAHPEVGEQVTEGLLKACVVGVTYSGFGRLEAKNLVAKSIWLLQQGGKGEYVLNLARENSEKPHIVPAAMIAMAQNNDWEAVRQLLKNDNIQDGHLELGRQLLASRTK